MRRWPFLTFVLLIYPVATACVCLASPGAPFPLQTQSLENSAWAFADFDGDNQLDFATARPRGDGGYVLEVELSSKRLVASERPLSLPSSAFGLHVLTQDVDGDHDLDIVITWGFAHLPVAIWINDGQGQFAEDSIERYPACNRPDSFLCPKSLPTGWQLVFRPSRRFGFSLEPGGRWLRPLLGSSAVLAFRSQLHISFSPADKQSARAPPPALFS
jgi:hypothetical protein